MAKLTVADGTKIRMERERADLTVDELVELLREEEGIERHPDTLRNVELNHAPPGLKLFNAIARVLAKRTGVEREQLLADEVCEESA